MECQFFVLLRSGLQGIFRIILELHPLVPSPYRINDLEILCLAYNVRREVRYTIYCIVFH